MKRTGTILGLAAAALASTAFSAYAVPAVGLSGGTSLFQFDTATPGTNSVPVVITGVNGSIVGVDYRPATGAFYGLSSAGSLYTINVSTGVATFASTLTTALTGGGFDISFNPTVDRLRIVSSSGQDLRVNVDTGAVTIDTPLAYGATDANAGRTPSVTAAGYTNQVGTATTTVLYDIDAATGALVTQAPPNNGQLNTVGSLNATGLVSLDIDPMTGSAFAASTTALYGVNLTTGNATRLGGFTVGNVTDFALVPTPEPESLALLGIGLAGVALMRGRRPNRAGPALS